MSCRPIRKWVRFENACQKFGVSPLLYKSRAPKPENSTFLDDFAALRQLWRPKYTIYYIFWSFMIFNCDDCMRTVFIPLHKAVSNLSQFHYYVSGNAWYCMMCLSVYICVSLSVSAWLANKCVHIFDTPHFPLLDSTFWLNSALELNSPNERLLPKISFHQWRTIRYY